MPISIGEVQAEVVVDAEAAKSPTSQGLNLPSTEDLLRWQQQAQSLERDRYRTLASGFDD